LRSYLLISDENFFRNQKLLKLRPWHCAGQEALGASKYIERVTTA
jgi:hypothetical protein